MLDRFQRSSVEAVREHQGKFDIVLDDPEHTVVSTAFPDERLSKDIERIEHYCEQVNREHNMGTFRGTPYGKSFYKEVARRFNAMKEEKKWAGQAKQ